MVVSVPEAVVISSGNKAATMVSGGRDCIAQHKGMYQITEVPWVLG